MMRIGFLKTLVAALAFVACGHEHGMERSTMAPRADPSSPYGVLPDAGAVSLTLEEQFELHRRAIEALLAEPALFGVAHLDPRAIVAAFPRLGTRPAPEALELDAPEEYWLNREAYVSALENDWGRGLLSLGIPEADAAEANCGEATCKQVSPNVKKCRNSCVAWWQITLSFDDNYDMCIRTDGHPMECPN